MTVAAVLVGCAVVAVDSVAAPVGSVDLRSLGVPAVVRPVLPPPVSCGPLPESALVAVESGSTCFDAAS